jgi:hypothetical protein
MATLELPVFVTVTLWADDVPSVTLPKLKLLVLKESVCDEATAVPLKLTTLGEPGALLTIDALPVGDPAEAGANCKLKVLDWPTLNVIGSVNPLVLKPLPVTFTWDIVKTAVPELVTLRVCEFEEPTETLPKLTVEGVKLNAGWMPLPLTGITALAPCELETVTLPLTLSELVGLNVKVNTAFCPAGKIKGVVMPLVLTSFALTLVCEIVRLEVPVLVNVTFWELELPALMFPKLMLAGAGVIVTDAATPVPLSATVAGEFGALLATLIAPVKEPAVVGANSALNDAVCPAARLTGVSNPLTL